MTQDDNVILTGLVLLSEAAAQGGYYSQQRKKICRDAGCRKSFGFAIAGEVEVGDAAQNRDVLERRRL